MLSTFSLIALSMILQVGYCSNTAQTRSSESENSFLVDFKEDFGASIDTVYGSTSGDDVLHKNSNGKSML